MARDDEMMTPDDSAPDMLVPTWTTDGHLDEGTIHAWLDEAFDAAHAAVVTAHVDGCERCRESVAEARGFIAGASRMVRALDAVPSGVVPHEDVERVASRIVAAAVAPKASSADRASVTPIAARARRAWYTSSVVRSAAAVLVMVAGGGYLLSRGAESASDMSVRVVDSIAPAIAAAPAVTPPASPVADAASMRQKLSDQPIVSDRREKRAIQPLSASSAKAEVAPIVANAADAVVADTARQKLMKSEPARNAATVASAPLPPAPVALPVSTMSDRGAPTRASAVGTTDSTRAFQRGMVAGGVARAPMSAAAEVARMDNALTVCWTLRATDKTSSLAATEKDDLSNLPLGLANGEFMPRSVVQVRWLDWPVAGRTTDVQIRMDHADTLNALGSADGRRLSLSLTRKGDSWIGTAVLRDEGELARNSAGNSARGVTHQVIMSRAEPSVCKR